MDVRVLIVGGVILLGVIIYYRPFASMWLVRRKCTETVAGKFVYAEWYCKPDGRGGGETTKVPAYEYTVDDKLYMVIVEGMEQAYDVFPLNVEVKYNPANPEVSFVNGKRGKIIKRK
ncbi:MAG: hypothetical protein IKX54_06120 [Lachnospiraceae bacterium]|nr:hypothetical protein [Lachnospiraceae bacterium]